MANRQAGEAVTSPLLHLVATVAGRVLRGFCQHRRKESVPAGAIEGFFGQLQVVMHIMG